MTPHWLGNGDIRVQGKTKDVETARGDFSQSLVVGGDNFYLGLGKQWKWTPDLLNKKYYHTDSNKRILVGARYQPYTIGLSGGNDGYAIEGGIQDKNTACTFSVEYRRRIHELLDATIEGKASCVKRF